MRRVWPESTKTSLIVAFNPLIVVSIFVRRLGLLNLGSLHDDLKSASNLFSIAARLVNLCAQVGAGADETFSVKFAIGAKN
jgi:hypothetical protein